MDRIELDQAEELERTMAEWLANGGWEEIAAGQLRAHTTALRVSDALRIDLETLSQPMM